MLPPFAGNVKIIDFDLSKKFAEPGEEIVATGRARIQKFWWWEDFDDALVEIKLNTHAYAKGRTDSEGYFEIPFAAPPIPAPAMWDVYVSLPKPHRDDCKHLECGPILLSVEIPPVEYRCPWCGAVFATEAELEAHKAVCPKRPPPIHWGKVLLYGSATLIGVGLLWSLVRK